VPSNGRTAISAIVSAVAAQGLTATATMLPREPLDEDEWSTLISHVRSERLEGHLARAVTDGSLPTWADQAEEASALHIRAMGLALTLESTLLAAADELEAAKIDFRVLKGPASAHLDYPDPSLRAFGDVDLLVRGEQFDAAVRVLTSGGFRRRTPEPRPGFDRRFGKGAVLVDPDGYEIDLHRTFAAGPFGISVDLDSVWRRAVPFAIGGHGLRALGTEERFLNACYHVVLGDVPPKLSPQRDIAQMLQARSLDFERIRALSVAWRGEVVVARALCLVWTTFELGDANAVSAWAKGYQPTRRELRALAACTGEHSSYVTKSLAGLRAVRGVRRKAAYLWALAVPTRRYLRERGTTVGARWRHGVDEAVGGRSDG
jgi:hypothetical protein